MQIPTDDERELVMAAAQRVNRVPSHREMPAADEKRVILAGAKAFVALENAVEIIGQQALQIQTLEAELAAKRDLESGSMGLGPKRAD